MSEDTDTWIHVWTADGGWISVTHTPAMLDVIDSVIRYPQGPVCLQLTSGTMATVRGSYLTGYFVNTPEHREKEREFKKSREDEQEAWR